MNIYTLSDLSTFEKNIDQLEEDLVKREDDILIPTLSQSKKMEKVVMDFVKEKQRKIYGGTAQNMLVKIKNKDDAFYKEGIRGDIDFYSPEPILDAMRLVNIFMEKGFQNVRASQAQHDETYSVFVEFTNIADISYVPKNIYHRIPFENIDGAYYVSAHFSIIDIYRMITTPLTSGSLRWRKTFPRLYLLQKHYPFNRATAPIPKIDPIDGKHKELVMATKKFLTGKNSVIVTGIHTYNVWLKESQIMSDPKIGKKYRELEVPHYEFTSTKYREDGKALFDILKKVDENIEIVEYYPLWQFLGYSTVISYKGRPVAHFFNYDHRCLPVKQAGGMQIGAYNFDLMMSMMMVFRHRVMKEKDEYQFRNIMLSHLVEMRNYYFQRTKKNFMEDTLFQELVMDCVGETMGFRRKAGLEREARIKAKKMITWNYNPAGGKTKEPNSTYNFANTSGNAIRKLKNMRIMDVGPTAFETTGRDVEEDPESDQEPRTESS